MNDNRRRQDAMYAKLALSAQDAPPCQGCPSPEDLAAFSQGRLQGARQEEVLRHLANCSDCHEELLAVTSLLADDPQTAPSRIPLVLVEALHQGAAWLTDLKKRISQGMRIPEQEAASLQPSRMALLLPGLTQPAEVMAQECPHCLLQCPWCGSVGQADQDLGEDAWIRCDACGGAFRP